MPILQPILNIAEICAKHGIENVIVSPGSRSAALTLAFARHPRINTFVIPDERAAAFVGMGLAQTSKKIVALICTSGTAATNFSPAVTEAFFQEIPLLIFTADRPKEWIHQYDGQTIFQSELYGKHVKASFELPADYTHPDSLWYIERTVNQAILLANATPFGPVHINVPIREPFYPKENETWAYDSKVRLIEKTTSEPAIASVQWHELLNEFDRYERVMIAAGQQDFDGEIGAVLKSISQEFEIPVAADVISNLNDADFITHLDVFLGKNDDSLKESLRPELLITFGKSFISKNLKLFLRKYKPIAHWHLQMSQSVIDPFQTLTKIILANPASFFKRLLEDLDYRRFREGDDDERDSEFFKNWQMSEQKSKGLIHRFLGDSTVFSEFQVVYEVLANLPDHCLLHLANSMAVRYANLIGVQPEKQVEVFANRGTSGIDGCLSTAVGSALATDKMVFSLIGDVAFFYDRNALWHSELPDNLRVVLLNNHGGNIFRLIDGPSDLPELETFFETPHTLTAERTAEDFGLTYFKADSIEGTNRVWASFLASTGKAKILEIQTDRAVNHEVFKAFKRFI